MREIKFKIYDKNDRNCIIGPFNWNKLPQFLYPDNFTLLQYTGLKDKNGKEIYEGDIFKGGDYKWDAVEFEDGQFQVNLMGARVFSLQELCCDYDSERPEVIGNIFENPELLE